MTQMNTGQVPGGPASGQFRIASANLHYVLSAYLPCPFLAGRGMPAGRLAAKLCRVPFTATRTIPR